MEYGLIGEKLGHSFSGEIHGKIGAYPYELREIPREGLRPFLEEKNFKGINVTIPYKQQVIPYLDHVEETAASIGAVNTVVNRGGELWGYNTDIYGLTELIRRVLRRSGRQTLEGLRVLILGTGGTSLTARAAAKALGAKEIFRVSRSRKEDALSYEETVREVPDAGFLINCTPAGMFPDVGGIPIHPSRFPSLVGVCDAVFNPLRTRLIREALESGIPAEGGLYMLVAQAVAAYEKFFGHEAGEADGSPAEAKNPASLVDAVFGEIQAEKTNLVLIGMPACGKTTVGKLLAKRRGSRFYDTDAEIVAREGKSIPEIFAENGEEYFRGVESAVISSLSERAEGAVIATGGGAVLNKSNMDSLSANGRILYLDRPLSLLTPTADRPTASDREAIQRRYEERKPLYEKYCDVAIDASGGKEQTVEKILLEIEKLWKSK